VFSTFLQELKPKFLIPNLTAGVVTGFISLALTISYAAIIFTGDLSPYLAAGTGIALISTFTIAIVIALFSPLKGSIAAIQDVPAAIIAATVVTMLGTLEPSLSSNEAFITVVAFCGLTTLITALVFLGLGYFRLAKLVRFLPYPVIGGFLAGTGWLLTLAGLSLMTGLQLDAASLVQLFQAEQFGLWVFGAVLAVVMVVIAARVKNPLAIPVTLVLATVSFFWVMFLSGGSLASWREAGLLLGPFPDQGLWRPISFSELLNVQWGLVFSQAAQAATIVISCLIALLLNATGVELSVKQDIDLNKELRVSGWGNVVIGFLGGIPGYLLLSNSVLNHKVGTGSRIGSVIAALLSLSALILGADFLSFVPRLIIGGLVMYLGLSFLYDWLYKAFFDLPKLEYAVILLILAVIIGIGFLEGIGVGLVAAVVLFIVNYSRTSIVKHSLSGSTMRSRVTRSESHKQYLASKGEESFILQLQGYIFFGTAHALFETIKAKLSEGQTLKFVILDFKQVNGLDATALLSFSKIVRLVKENNAQLVISDLSVRLKGVFKSLEAEYNDHLYITKDLDFALEYCEEQLLKEHNEQEITFGLRERLLQLEPDSKRVDTLLSYFEKLEYKSGDYLIKQGDAANDLIFIESGQVTAQLEQNGEVLRFETMQRGSVVGELGFYTGDRRSASVIADEFTYTYVLTKSKLEKMTKEEPRCAALFHDFNMQLLSLRTVHLMNVVNALQR